MSKQSAKPKLTPEQQTAIAEIRERARRPSGSG
jgi:hypothetical protein